MHMQWIPGLPSPSPNPKSLRVESWDETIAHNQMIVI